LVERLAPAALLALQGFGDARRQVPYRQRFDVFSFAFNLCIH
jgi:hypothetical protein